MYYWGKDNMETTDKEHHDRNVRTLHACGKVKEHELARHKWDILGLAEVRWAGFGETTTEDGHKL